MLTSPATPEMIEDWNAVWNTYHSLLCPNRKTAAELIAYLKKYPLIECYDETSKCVVIENVMNNAPYFEKLPTGAKPKAVAFCIAHSGEGNILYEKQDEQFKGLDIRVGVEMETSFFIVEGSGLLLDELFAFRGLDESDIENPYLVAEYISYLRRFGMLEQLPCL